MAAAEAEESRAHRGREEGGGTCYNATHEAVVANGNEQDDRRERERGGMDVYVCVQNEEMLRHHNMDRSEADADGSDDNANRKGSMWKWIRSMNCPKSITTEC